MQQDAKKPRQRAMAGAPGVGIARYMLYKSAFERVAAAIERGYHLEAITLLESLLTDRMESRASYITKTNVGFRTLGQVITLLGKHEQVEAIKTFVKSDVDAWRVRRNSALHELVKMEPGDRRTWEERIASLAETAREGIRVLRHFDSLNNQDRKKNGSPPGATEPDAFASTDTGSPPPMSAAGDRTTRRQRALVDAQATSRAETPHRR